MFQWEQKGWKYSCLVPILLFPLAWVTPVWQETGTELMEMLKGQKALEVLHKPETRCKKKKNKACSCLSLSFSFFVQHFKPSFWLAGRILRWQHPFSSDRWPKRIHATAPGFSTASFVSFLKISWDAGVRKHHMVGDIHAFPSQNINHFAKCKWPFKKHMACRFVFYLSWSVDCQTCVFYQAIRFIF